MSEMLPARQANHRDELFRLTSSMARNVGPRQWEQSTNAG